MSPRLLVSILAIDETDSTPTSEEAQRTFGMMAAQIAAYIREVRPPGGEWEPATYTPEEVDLLPPDDVDLLESVVQRRVTPEQASAIARGEAPPDEEVGIEDLATFRDDAGGDVAVDDGADVGDTPEPPAGDGG